MMTAEAINMTDAPKTWADVPLVLTVEDAAELLRVHTNTVKTWIREGKLPAVKIGKDWRIKREDVFGLLGVDLEAGHE